MRETVLYVERNGRQSPFFKGIPGWPEPKGVLRKHFYGKKRLRKKAIAKWFSRCLHRAKTP